MSGLKSLEPVVVDRDASRRFAASVSQASSGRNSAQVCDAAGDYNVVLHLQCAGSLKLSKHIHFCNKIH